MGLGPLGVGHLGVHGFGPLGLHGFGSPCSARVWVPLECTGLGSFVECTGLVAWSPILGPSEYMSLHCCASAWSSHT